MIETRTTHRPKLPDILDHAAGLTSALRERFSTERFRHDSVLWPEAASRMAGMFGTDADIILAEPALQDVGNRTRDLLSDIRAADPFRNRWASDSVFSTACYLACRLVKPEVVIETGVAYGVSSAFMLAALRENGHGILHSVDLMPLRRRAADFQGIAVREHERENWNLHHGSSRRILPGLLSELGSVDIFLHDSLHTRSNMAFEFELALRYLRPGGMLLADDVERNGAFGELAVYAPALHRIVSDRETEPLHGRKSPVVFGVVVK